MNWIVDDCFSRSEEMIALNWVTVVKIGPRTKMTSMMGIANWAGVILFRIHNAFWFIPGLEIAIWIVHDWEMRGARKSCTKHDPIFSTILVQPWFKLYGSYYMVHIIGSILYTVYIIHVRSHFSGLVILNPSLMMVVWILSSKKFSKIDKQHHAK